MYVNGSEEFNKAIDDTVNTALTGADGNPSSQNTPAKHCETAENSD